MAAGYQKAFQRLGYSLISPRQDWSAANESGVCISLWQAEIAWKARAPFFDTREHANADATWVNKPGAARRTEHLILARDKFDGWLDLVLRHGAPSDEISVPSSPWIVSERQDMKWRLTFFDQISRHFAVSVEPLPN